MAARDRPVARGGSRSPGNARASSLGPASRKTVPASGPATHTSAGAAEETGVPPGSSSDRTSAMVPAPSVGGAGSDLCLPRQPEGSPGSNQRRTPASSIARPTRSGRVHRTQVRSGSTSSSSSRGDNPGKWMPSSPAPPTVQVPGCSSSAEPTPRASKWTCMRTGHRNARASGTRRASRLQGVRLLPSMLLLCAALLVGACRDEQAGPVHARGRRRPRRRKPPARRRRRGAAGRSGTSARESSAGATIAGRTRSVSPIASRRRGSSSQAGRSSFIWSMRAPARCSGNADHPPPLPLEQWPVGKPIQDVQVLALPPGAPEIQVLLGFWHDDQRLPVDQPAAQDGQQRMRGPVSAAELRRSQRRTSGRRPPRRRSTGCSTIRCGKARPR